MSKKVLSLLLAIAMAFTSTGIVFAENDGMGIGTEVAEEIVNPEDTLPDGFGENEIAEPKIALMGVPETSVISGNCGDDVTFEIDEENVMYIQGSGALYDELEASWGEYASDIVEVIIDDGITKITDSAFSSFVNLEKITIPESVIEIGENAFVNNDGETPTKLEITMVVPRDSYAEEYATDNSFEIEYSDDLPEYTKKSISEACAIEDDTKIEISGTVTYCVDDYAYIQDETGAIAVLKSNIDSPESGDVYSIKGTVAKDDEEIINITVADYQRTARAQTLPVTYLTTVKDLAEGKHQGEIIRIEGVRVVFLDDDSITVRDDNTNAVIQLYKYASFNGNIKVNSLVDVTGIASMHLNNSVIRTISSSDISFTAVPVEIYTESDLVAIQNNMQYNYKLMNDIELSNNWVCIGDNSRKYNGIFDGQGHTISNVNVVLDQEYQFYYAGIFGALSNIGTIKNLNVEISGKIRSYNIVDTSYAGGIVGSNEGKIYNCNVMGCVDGNCYVGGIAGINAGQIYDCSFDGEINAIGSYSGGIVGYNKGSVHDCDVDIEMKAESYAGGAIGYGYQCGDIYEISVSGKIKASNYVGGVIGNIEAVSGKNIYNCEVDCSISAGENVGGIVGYNRSKPAIIHDCHFAGNIAAYSYTGGIVGQTSANIYDCYMDKGQVDGDSNVGGIVGYLYNTTLDNCYCDDSVSGSSSVGGVVGMAESSTVKNSHATGDAFASNSKVGGLIGYCYESNTVTDCYATGDVKVIGSNVGGLIGEFAGYGEVKDCYSLGSVYATNNYAGGIIGQVDNACWYDRYDTAFPKVTNCKYSGSLTGANYIGGIVGGSDYYYNSSYQNLGLYITKCYANVKIKGAGYLGGIIGYTYKLKMVQSFANGSIEGTGDYVGGAIGYYDSISDYPVNDSYSTVSVTGNKYVAGFIGYVCNGIIERNYSVGRVTPIDPITGGGFIGYNSAMNNILRNYFDLEASGQGDDTKGVPKTTAQMRNTASYVAWDFANVWKMETDKNNGYPQLRETETIVGTEKDVVLISTEEELYNIRLNINGKYRLTNDIVLTKEWNSIEIFSGELDGNGYAIKNVNINNAKKNYVGFIGRLYYATVNNLSIEIGEVSGNNYTGGLCGDVTSSTITDCSVTGEFVGNNYTGGLCGDVTSSTITDCTADITVNGNSYVGGFVGYLVDSTVNHSVAKADVKATGDSAGGFAGYIYSYSNTVNINDSYSTGSVNSTSYYVGGFVGYNYHGYIYRCYSNADVYSSYESTDNFGFGGFVGRNNGYIYDSYATGNVTGYSYVGGFVGYNDYYYCYRCYSVGKVASRYSNGEARGFSYSGSNYYCYFDKDNSRTTNGNGTGYTTEQMKNKDNYSQYSSNNTNGWNFDTVWAIDEEHNNGYPYLRTTYPTISMVTIDKSDMSLYVGDTVTLVGTIYPSDALQLYTWKSSDETVATVNKNGFVTALKEGYTIITFTAGNVSTSITITVLQQQNNGNIISIEDTVISDIDYYTSYDEIVNLLPEVSEVKLANGSSAKLPVSWKLKDNTTYEFEGTLTLPYTITNTSNIVPKAIVNVLDKPSEIASVEELSVTVPFATLLENTFNLLPNTVKVTLENGKEYELYVLWDSESTPYYKSTTSGEYVFSGEIILPVNGTILNSKNKEAKIKVTVSESTEKIRKITACVANDSIVVPYNTSLAEIKEMLPTTTNVVLDSFETVPLAVVWSNNTSPEFEPKIPGTYSFTGTITDTGTGLIKNPLGLSASINVIVSENVEAGNNIYVSKTTGEIGSTTAVTVSFDKNSSMATGSFVIDFDATKLTPVSYTVNEAIEQASVMVNLNYTDPTDKNKKVKVSFLSLDEMNLGGDAITIVYKINDSVVDGTEIPVGVKSVNISDTEEQLIAFDVYSGMVTAYNVIKGDVTGDGIIDIFDAFRIVRFEAGFVELTNRQKMAADVDKNDEIDIFDAMKIQKFDIGLSSTLE